MAGKPKNLKNMKFDKLTAIEVFSRGANKFNTRKTWEVLTYSS